MRNRTQQGRRANKWHLCSATVTGNANKRGHADKANKGKPMQPMRNKDHMQCNRPNCGPFVEHPTHLSLSLWLSLSLRIYNTYIYIYICIIYVWCRGRAQHPAFSQTIYWTYTFIDQNKHSNCMASSARGPTSMGKRPVRGPRWRVTWNMQYNNCKPQHYSCAGSHEVMLLGVLVTSVCLQGTSLWQSIE